MTRRTASPFLSLTLAALMTLGMLGGIDRLARSEAAQAVMTAQGAVAGHRV